MKHNRSKPISIRTLFWKVFPPFEVKLTVDAIDGFMSEHSPLSSAIIARDAVALAKNAGQTIYSIRIDGMKPDQLALILICNVVGGYLSRGNHHTYRGVLSVTGQDMLDVWTKAISALNERGYYTNEQAADDMNWIKEQIKIVG